MTAAKPRIVRVGGWVQLTASARARFGIGRFRMHVDHLDADEALVHVPRDDGWPFPTTFLVPRHWLEYAPTPRQQRLSGSVDAST